MQKQLGTIAAVIAFLSLAVVLIQHEDEKTRESINEAGKEIAGGVRDGIVDGVERTIDKAAEVRENEGATRRGCPAREIARFSCFRLKHQFHFSDRCLA